MVVAAVVLVVLRDHRVLRRYTYLAGAIGFVLLLLPLLPGHRHLGLRVADLDPDRPVLVPAR